MKVYSSIWRLIRVPDDDFETMLPSFAKYATSIAKLASLCTTYRRRPTRTVQLCTSVHETADDFFEALGDISGWDWVETLKDKTSYDVTKSDAEHAQLIMGNLYESYMEDERNAVLERFVAWRGISEASRKKTYPTPISKLTYLVEKFPVFLNAAPPSGSRILAQSPEPDDEIISSKKGRKRLNGRSKTSKTQLKLNSSAEMHTLRVDYFNHLQNQPHVAGLLAFCLKQNSKNLEIFPDNNIIRRRANEYTSAGGTFDWDKFNQGN
uniref:Uncharacterized protein n=1 Tax=Panagrolaimus superbus TaxID=310955 RepID=A0A914YU74_9BILA